MTAVDLVEDVAEMNVQKLIKQHEKESWQHQKQINCTKTSTCWYAWTITLGGYRPPACLHMLDTNSFYRRGSHSESSLWAGGLASLKQKPRLKRATFVCTSGTAKHKCVFVSLAHFCSTFMVACDTTRPRRVGGLIPLLGCCGLTTTHNILKSSTHLDLDDPEMFSRRILTPISYTALRLAPDKWLFKRITA